MEALSKMVRVAIPIFHGRVSPVLDLCTRLRVMDIDGRREVARRELSLDNFLLSERFNLITQSGIDVIICCGISDVLDNMLQTTDIRLFWGIAGNADQVVDAFVCNRLDDPVFHMPGYTENPVNPLDE